MAVKYEEMKKYLEDEVNTQLSSEVASSCSLLTEEGQVVLSDELEDSGSDKGGGEMPGNAQALETPSIQSIQQIDFTQIANIDTLFGTKREVYRMN